MKPTALVLGTFLTLGSAAISAEFAPGTRAGKPVAVEITIELTFTLKQ